MIRARVILPLLLRIPPLLKKGGGMYQTLLLHAPYHGNLTRMMKMRYKNHTIPAYFGEQRKKLPSIC